MDRLYVRSVRFATVALLLVTALSSTVAACAGHEDDKPPARSPSHSNSNSNSVTKSAAQPKRGEGLMRDPRPSTMGAALKEIGLDPKNLPPLETLDAKQKLHVMNTFTDALGIACTDCHAQGDFKVDTRRKRVAKRMFNEIVRVTAFENGDAIYCDSCHQGAMFILARQDKSKVSDFMSDQLVGKLKRTDNRDHDCGTCHGDPPDFKFITAWKQSPAPDIDLAVAVALPSSPSSPASPASPPVADARHPSPTTTPPPPTTTAPAAHKPVVAAIPSAAPAPPAAPPTSTPPPATPSKPKATATTQDCGAKGELCPLQTWMRQYIATAVAAGDTSALAKALDRVSGMSPDPSWGSWVEISKAGADAARSGDMTEARKSCPACHTAYKNRWRETYRSRAVK